MLRRFFDDAGFVQTPSGDSKWLRFLPDICNADIHKATFSFSAKTYTVLNELGLQRESCATPKVTKYQRFNFIIQIHQFTIKIDKININLLFECVKIVEFNFNSLVFHVMYQETRFLNQDACFLNQEGRWQFFISFVSKGFTWKLRDNTTHSKGLITWAGEALRMKGVLPAVLFVAWFIRQTALQSVITWKISTRDPGITLLGSQLTRLARLSDNRKVDFCCV